MGVIFGIHSILFIKSNPFPDLIGWIILALGNLQLGVDVSISNNHLLEKTKPRDGSR